MDAPITIELPYPPVTGNHATRHANGAHYRQPAAVKYRGLIRMLIASQRLDLGLPGPLQVDWVLAPPDRRARDQTNVLKEVEDCLTAAGLWTDDSNKVIRRTTVEWTDPIKDGAVLVTVRPFVSQY